MALKTTTKQEFTNDVAAEAKALTTSAETSSAELHVTCSACGGALKLAREQLNLTVHDIANSLRLSDKQIEAIEADHFHLLPQPSIVRGFIRNYAKSVKIDAEPIIAAYNARVPDAAPQSFTVKSNTTQYVIGENKAGFSPGVFISLMMLFGLVAAGFYYYTEHIKPSTVKPETTLTQPSEELNVDVTADSVSAEFALPTAERQTSEADTETSENTIAADSTQTTELTLPTPAAITNNTTTLNETTPLTPPAVSNSPMQANTGLNNISDQTNLNNQASSTRKRLEIKALEETWVNIIDSSGKQIYNKVLTQGQSDTIEVLPPLKLTIGNAQQTTLNVNGQPIDLMAHTRHRVARVNIHE